MLKNSARSSSTLARSTDGTVQITFTIPAPEVDEATGKAFSQLLGELQIPGFRRGKVPQDVARRHVSAQKLTERVLTKLLPQAYATAIEKHKIRPILSPRFELISVAEGKDWQIRAITCELPKVNLPDYKKEIDVRTRGKNIWVPGKQEKKGAGREEKEQKVIEVLLETANVQIPRLLIDEEVNHRLARLLEQTQTLGLSVEKYLASIGKTSEQLRDDYEKQAQASLKLELVLNAIAEKEGIAVADLEVDEVIKTVGSKETAQKLSTPQQKQLIKGVLARRKAVDLLVSLL